MMSPQMLSLVIVLVVMGTAMRAEAGRWKIGTGPQQCKTATGGNCYWGTDTGPNQCTCATTTSDAWAPVSAGATYGKLTITPRATGLVNVVEGDIRATLYATGEVVTVRWRGRVDPTDLARIAYVSSELRAFTATNLPTLDGPNHNQIPISRTSGGWIPPRGSTPQQACLVGWGTFVANEFNCYTDTVGHHVSAGLSTLSVIASGSVIGGCLSGKTMNFATWFTCAKLASYTSAGLFVGGVVNSIFFGPSPTSKACNANDYARGMMNKQCGTNFPQVRY